MRADGRIVEPGLMGIRKSISSPPLSPAPSGARHSPLSHFCSSTRPDPGLAVRCNTPRKHMWCHHCDSDVAAEIGPGGQRAHCATCGNEIAARGTPAQATRTREALQLLDRWSRPQLLDPFQTTPGQERETDDPEVVTVPVPQDPAASIAPEPHETPSSIAEEPVTAVETEECSESHDDESADMSEESVAVDADEIVHDKPPKHADVSSETEGDSHTIETLIPQRSRLAVATLGTESAPTSHTVRHETEIPMTDDSRVRSHGTVRDSIAPDDGTNWVALAGQLLAYGGVAVLTVGTTLALWAHFAGQPSHVPTGWLIAAAGQMLLFLGVVTLVSTGIEQTAIDLQRRFDRVADRLGRVEDGLDTRHHERRRSSHVAESSDDVDERIAA